MKFFNTTLPICILFAASCLVNVANAGIIHSYDFSGNAMDSTGSANGNVQGATLTTDRHGNIDSAYNFDGNDSIVANFSSPTTATFSMWATWNGNEMDMLFNSGPNGSGPDLFFYNNNISWNTWDSAQNSFGLLTNTNFNDGEFHHYAVVNDAVNFLTTLYIDGTVFGTATYKHRNTNVFTIGAANSGGGYGWNGKIDDVQIYDTALDISGVQSLIAPNQVPEPSTLAIFALGIMGLAARHFKKKS